MGLLDKAYELLAETLQPGLSEKKDTIIPTLLPGTSEQHGPYANIPHIQSRIKDHVEKVSRSRTQFERGWFQSISYYVGNQWIKWDDARRDYRPRNLKRKWVPKPVTNRLASCVDTIRGALETIKMSPSFWPSTGDSTDIASAGVAEKIRPIMDDEVQIQRVKREVSAWVVLTGDAFTLPYYDLADSSLGFTEIPNERCVMCGHSAQPKDFEDAGKCPGCDCPLMTEPDVDPETGKTASVKYPVGRQKIDVLSPLELYFSLDNRSWNEVRKWTRVRSFDADYVKSTFPEMGKYAQPTMGSGTKQALHYLDMIAYMTTSTTQTAARSQGQKIALYWHFEMPTEEFPEGLWAIMADDMTMLECGPSPWYEESADGTKCYYNPIDQFGYMEVPGRLYHKTPITDLIPKQDQRNRIESLMELSLMKGVYNTWLLPAGSSIHRIAGEPAQHIRWTPQGTAGAKPEVITAEPFTAACMTWVEKIDSDFEELGGTFDALKGNVPRGVSAGYAIQLLTEKSFGRFGTVFNNFDENHACLYKKMLMIFRKNVTEQRLLKIKGDTGAFEVQAFIGSDIRGSVDVRIEGGASKPRTKLAEQALIETFVKIGVIDPHDSEQKFAIAQLFGMGHMLGSYGDDQREAAREWQEFTQGKPPAMLPDVDNHLMHSLEHKRMAKTDVFRAMPVEHQNFWLLHIKDHNEYMMMQMMGAAPPPEAGAKPGQAPDKSGAKPPTSKANETSDKTMDTLRGGGNSTMGSGGKNQHAAPAMA